MYTITNEKRFFLKAQFAHVSDLAQSTFDVLY